MTSEQIREATNEQIVDLLKWTVAGMMWGSMETQEKGKKLFGDLTEEILKRLNEK